MTSAQTTPQMDLNDDDLVDLLWETAQRVAGHVKGSSAEAFDRDERAQDAVRGCLLVMGGAAGEVSDHLRNWLTTVPWEALLRQGSWREHSGRESVRRAWDFTQTTVPAVLEALESFRNPRTQ